MTIGSRRAVGQPTIGRSAVRRLAMAADRIVQPGSGVVVLVYHRVGGDTTSEIDLDPAVFEDHLASLKQRKAVIPLDAAVAALAAGHGVEGVVLTFDDGTADFTDVVVPALVRHQLPATVFVTTAYVDGGRPFPWGARPTSWPALRDATSTGLIAVGSHTHSHRLLDRLDSDAVAEELDRSIALIGEHTGTAPDHFAYPKAVPGSPAAEIAVRLRFRSAALASNRVNRPGHADVHRLGRTPIQRSDSPAIFTAKVDGGMRLEGVLRSLAARQRLRGQSW